MQTYTHDSSSINSQREGDRESIKLIETNAENVVAHINLLAHLSAVQFLERKVREEKNKN